MKVTRKLLNQLLREMRATPCSREGKRRRHKRGMVIRSSGAVMVAALAVSVWLVTPWAAMGAQSGEGTVATSGYSAATLFNQANGYARQDKAGLAILNYERARLLAPDDADIAANLHFVRAKAGLPDAPERWFSRGLSHAHPNTLAWLGCLGLVLVGMSMMLVRLRPERRFAFRVMALVGALLIASAIGSASTMWPRVKEAVVIARGAPARTSPASVAEPAFTLREGEIVTVRAELENFDLVQTAAGRAGWVARADLALVVPRTRGAPEPRNHT
jgi:hypothetical protein